MDIWAWSDIQRPKKVYLPGTERNVTFRAWADILWSISAQARNLSLHFRAWDPRSQARNGPVRSTFHL